MFEYIFLPFIAVILALRTIHQVSRVVKNIYAGPLTGLAAFLFCFQAAGHLMYGVVLAIIISALAITATDSP